MSNENYDDLMDHLLNVTLKATQYSLKIPKLLFEATDYSLYLGDMGGGFFDKIGAGVEAISIRNGRNKTTKKLNDAAKESILRIDKWKHTLDTANDLLRTKNIPEVHFDNKIKYYNFDIDCSADNEDWFDQFSEGIDAIIDTFDNFNDSCDKASNLLEKIGFRKAASKE